MNPDGDREFLVVENVGVRKGGPHDVNTETVFAHAVCCVAVGGDVVAGAGGAVSVRGADAGPGFVERLRYAEAVLAGGGLGVRNA